MKRLMISHDTLYFVFRKFQGCFGRRLRVLTIRLTLAFAMILVFADAAFQGEPNTSGPKTSAQASAKAKPQNGCHASPFSAREVVIVSIKQVPAGEFTYGNPPIIKVEVIEVLAGKGFSDHASVSWGPKPHDFDTSGREAELEAWRRKSLVVPKVGEKWILWGSALDGKLITDARGRMMANEKNLALARRMVGSVEDARAIQNKSAN
ncbi:MAG: hypothetical protein K8T91_10605 [Planctomycetes bacterium]|nr:hypothetical protein [Planctomycetota bacterium]